MPALVNVGRERRRRWRSTSSSSPASACKGLALAHTLGYVVGAAVAAVLLARRTGGLELRRTLIADRRKASPPPLSAARDARRDRRASKRSSTRRCCARSSQLVAGGTAGAGRLPRTRAGAAGRGPDALPAPGPGAVPMSAAAGTDSRASTRRSHRSRPCVGRTSGIPVRSGPGLSPDPPRPRRRLAGAARARPRPGQSRRDAGLPLRLGGRGGAARGPRDRLLPRGRRAAGGRGGSRSRCRGAATPST